MNILVTLFAVLDCGIWNATQFTSWADNLIIKLKRPKSWLIDLSMSNTVSAGLEIIRNAIIEYELLLPESIVDLMVGLILLRFDNGDLSFSDAHKKVVDILDAYEGSRCVYIDAESAMTLDLDAPIYLEFRMLAKQAMTYLCNGELLETDLKFIED
jgi:hypothetical protein